MEETADTTTENSHDNQVAGGSGNPVNQKKASRAKRRHKIQRERRKKMRKMLKAMVEGQDQDKNQDQPQQLSRTQRRKQNLKKRKAKDCPLCRCKSPTHVGIPCGHGICCDCANLRYHSTGEDQIDPFVDEVACVTCQSKVKLYTLHLD